MRKLYEATGGQPQRWESLGNLGAVKADAAAIAYAVERDWLVISGGFHSVKPHRGRPAPVEVAAAPFAGVADSPAIFSPEAIYPFS
jgi:hypothetical protein